MKNHITNIKITNFKCFKNFKVKNLAQVNLITGKNNVGKTAFLEACLTNAYSQNITTTTAVLCDIKIEREVLNILLSLGGQNINSFLENNSRKYLEKLDGINIESNINAVSFSISNDNGIKKYHFKFNNKSITVNVNDFSFEFKEISNINFISNFGPSNTEIITHFSAMQKLDKEDSLNTVLNDFDISISISAFKITDENMQKLDKEDFLNTVLNDFDSSISAFKIIDEKPQCKIGNKYLEITELGDGTKRLVSIVILLFVCKNGCLFIDEIDNGIHYEKLDALWEVILKLSKEQQVQVFATTHSKECLQSYVRVATKLADKEVACIRLNRLKNGKIHPSVYDYETLEYAITQEHEVR